MPFYRFMVHGTDDRVPNGERGFFTTRHAFGTNQNDAADKVFQRLRDEFTSGASSSLWASSPPSLTIEKAWRIGWHQLLSAPNRGSTFYDERK